MNSNLIYLKESIIEITSKIDNSLESLFFSCEQVSVASNLKQRINANENEINHNCDSTLNLCMQLLEEKSPKGKDLRFVIGSMRMVREMERIGDHIVTISKWVHKLPSEQMPIVVDMLREILLMNRTVIDAFVLERLDLAEQTIQNDQVINEFNKRIIKSFLNDELEIENIRQGYYSTRVAKSIERIGDYIKNLAEEVIFIEGKDLSLNATHLQQEKSYEKTCVIS